MPHAISRPNNTQKRPLFMKAKTTPPLVAVLGALALSATMSHAALVWNTGSPVVTTLDSTEFMTQTPLAAFNLGGGTSGSVVWGGETWHNMNAAGGTVNGITLATTGLNNIESGKYTGGTVVLDSNLNNSSSVPNVFVTLSGFDPTKEYQVQFLVADSRNDIRTRQAMMREHGTSNSSPIGTPIGSSPVGSFVVFSGILTNASTISVDTLLASAGSTPNWNMGQINAVRVSLIPEPASALLGSFGMLFLLRRRRAAV